MTAAQWAVLMVVRLVGHWAACSAVNSVAWKAAQLVDQMVALTVGSSVVVTAEN